MGINVSLDVSGVRVSACDRLLTNNELSNEPPNGQVVQEEFIPEMVTDRILKRFQIFRGQVRGTDGLCLQITQNAPPLLSWMLCSKITDSLTKLRALLGLLP